MGLIDLLILLMILSIFGVLPRWQYSSNWGYGPVGALFIIIIVLCFVRGRF